MESSKDKIEAKLSQSLINGRILKKILSANHGYDTKLVDWKLVFMEKGENFTSVVVTVKVVFTKTNRPKTIFIRTFVIKLNSERESVQMKEFCKNLFIKEVSFYKKLVPLLNQELEDLELHPLRIPKLLHGNLDNDRELIIFEDLRNDGFKMVDRRKGLDFNHVCLVLEELARLHAASILLLRKNKYTNFLENFSFLDEIYWRSPADKDAYECIKMFFKSCVETGAKVVEKFPEYTETAEWVKNMAPMCYGQFMETLIVQDPFRVIGHGDCWNNNILFRQVKFFLALIYNDLQKTRVKKRFENNHQKFFFSNFIFSLPYNK